MKKNKIAVRTINPSTFLKSLKFSSIKPFSNSRKMSAPNTITTPPNSVIANRPPPLNIEKVMADKIEA